MSELFRLSAIEQRLVNGLQQIWLVRLDREYASHQCVLKSLVADESFRLVAVLDVLRVGEQEREKIRQLSLLDVLDEPTIEAAPLTLNRLFIQKI